MRSPAPSQPRSTVCLAEEKIDRNCDQLFLQRGNRTKYTYDNINQLLSSIVGGSANNVRSESFAYDATGNRTSQTVGTGTSTSTKIDASTKNRLTSDGTYSYTYDDEGNLIKKTTTATGAYEEYTWDNRDRMIQVNFKTSAGVLQKSERFTYDAFDRRVMTEFDPTGAVTTTTPPQPVYATSERYVYDGDMIALVLTGTTVGSVPAGTITHRFLNGADIDQVFADESSNGLFWYLTDNQNTVRDVVNSTGSTVVDHLTYSAFGAIQSETDATKSPFDTYAGRPLDRNTGLNDDRARPYRSATGTFDAEDPLRIAAGDVKFNRYTGNSPTNFTDPSGLFPGGSPAAFGPRGVGPGSMQPSGPTWNPNGPNYVGSGEFVLPRNGNWNKGENGLPYRTKPDQFIGTPPGAFSPAIPRGTRIIDPPLFNDFRGNGQWLRRDPSTEPEPRFIPGGEIGRPGASRPSPIPRPRGLSPLPIPGLFGSERQVPRCPGMYNPLPRNWRGETIFIPEGHTLSPLDRPWSAAPIFDPGPFTSEQRQAFLNGRAGGTGNDMHHRGQLPILFGGVHDELPGPRSSQGNQHTGEPRHINPSIWSELDRYESGFGTGLRQRENQNAWIAKGKRLIERSPGKWYDSGPPPPGFVLPVVPNF